MEYIALQIYRSANFRQKRQTFQVASFVCVYARIHIGSADFVQSSNRLKISGLKFVSWFLWCVVLLVGRGPDQFFKGMRYILYVYN